MLDTQRSAQTFGTIWAFANPTLSEINATSKCHGRKQNGKKKQEPEKETGKLPKQQTSRQIGLHRAIFDLSEAGGGKT